LVEKFERENEFDRLPVKAFETMLVMLRLAKLRLFDDDCPYAVVLKIASKPEIE
jgi:hypothetical protein